MRMATAVVGTLLILAAAASATTYVVRPDGLGDFPTIQAAIDSVSNDDIIELTDGDFTGTGNYNISFGGKRITVRSQSGDPEACVIDCEGSYTNNWRRGVSFTMNEGSGTVLEGVTIKRAYLVYDPGTRERTEVGAGILCTNGSPTITNCIIRDNDASSRDDGGLGGGMYCGDGSSPTLIGCVFHNNTAWSDCSCSYGGGMYCADGSFPTLSGCTFTSNSAEGYGAAIYFASGSSGTLTDCVIASNDWLHAMGCVGASPQLTNCSFVGNFGYAVKMVGGSPTFTDCFFGAGNYGPDCNNSSPTFNGCTFCTADWGLDCASSSPTVTKCTFTGNTGGIFCTAGSSPTVTHTIIAFNTPGAAVSCDATSSATLSCSDVYGNGADWSGCIGTQGNTAGNISADPLFCGSAYPPEPYTLDAASPCAAENSTCGRMGAWDVACGWTIAEDRSWGSIKALFR